MTGVRQGRARVTVRCPCASRGARPDDHALAAALWPDGASGGGTGASSRHGCMAVARRAALAPGGGLAGCGPGVADRGWPPRWPSRPPRQPAAPARRRPPRRSQTAVISRSGGRAQRSRTGPRSPSPIPPRRRWSQCHLVVTSSSPCRAGAGARPPTCTRPARGSCESNAPSCLPGDGRRTIFLAARHGSTWLGATVPPASNLMMPAWGGKVIVRPARRKPPAGSRPGAGQNDQDKQFCCRSPLGQRAR